MRWRRFRENADSAIRNQQIDRHRRGVHVHHPAPVGPGRLPLQALRGRRPVARLLGPDPGPRATARRRTATASSDPTGTQRPRQRKPWEHPALPRRRDRSIPAYRDGDLIDPYGLIYRLDAVEARRPRAHPVSADPRAGEPLVLWCREGERVEVALANPCPLGWNPNRSRLRSRSSATGRSPQHVSMHADLVAYDVRASDGANVGQNPVQTVPPGGSLQPRIYTWDTGRPDRREVKNRSGPCCSRTWPTSATTATTASSARCRDPRRGRHAASRGTDESTSSGEDEVWYGTRVTVGSNATVDDDGDEAPRRSSLLIQDGLRLFLNGNQRFPLPDPPDEEAGEAEHEDQGQKGINYRSEPVAGSTRRTPILPRQDRSRDTCLARAERQHGPLPPGRGPGQASGLQLHHSRSDMARAPLPTAVRSCADGLLRVRDHLRHSTHLHIHTHPLR